VAHNKVLRATLVLLIVAVQTAWAQQSPLDQILQKLDQTAANFHSTEATFVWDEYQKVVDETDQQQGKVYFRRTGDGVDMAADITSPSPEQVVFSGSKVQLYQPNVEQLKVYKIGKDKSAVESFLVLGFGGSGQDMLKSYDVKYIGPEKIFGVDTVKLELIPKSQNVKDNYVNRILLWVDTARGVSVQQQLFLPEGDYKLAKYSDIKLNEKIPDAAFKLKTTSKTKVISPQG
jgi:outer membrane lipoprotein-sorting protein